MKTDLTTSIAAVLILAGTPVQAEVVHTQFAADNYMVDVSGDSWQPERFNNGTSIRAAYVAQGDITLDGRDDEPAWTKAGEVVVPLAFGNVTDAAIKALYTDRDVFIRVRWADDTQDREHRPWVWSAEQKKYVTGPQVEDSLLLSFEAGCEWSPSILAGHQFDFDAWQWNAARTDPVGQAWDLIVNLSAPGLSAWEVSTYDARIPEDPSQGIWILKFGDHYPVDQMTFGGWSELSRTYLHWPVIPEVSVLPLLDRMKVADGSEHMPAPSDPPSDPAETFPQFKAVALAGAAGEVGAKGHWEDGYWTVEFRRNRVTPDTNLNDTVFNRLTQFSVHVFDHSERVDESSESGRLFLEFLAPETHLVEN